MIGRSELSVNQERFYTLGFSEVITSPISIIKKAAKRILLLWAQCLVRPCHYKYTALFFYLSAGGATADITKGLFLSVKTPQVFGRDLLA